jgi:negative regulator of sigma E activity
MSQNMKQFIRESWLSAYVDGELSAEQRSALERTIRKNTKLAKKVEELKSLGRALRSLPSLRLSPSETEELWQYVLSHPKVTAAAAWAIDAYMDGELSREQTGIFSRRVSENAELRETLRDWIEPSSTLTQLPIERCPQEIVDRVVRQMVSEESKVTRALREVPFEPFPAPQLPGFHDRTEPPKPSRHSNWTWQQWMGIPLVCSVLTVIGLLLNSNGSNQTVATNPKSSVVSSNSANSEFVASLQKSTDHRGFDANLSLALAPGPHQPLVDQHLLPDVPKHLPVSITDEPLKRLDQLIRPGQQITLPHSQITFVCLDVAEMYDRLQVVLLQHSIKSERKDLPEQHVDGQILTVEIAATPDQLTQVLANLRTAEDSSRLLTAVEVSEPRKPLMGKSSGFSEFVSKNLLENQKKSPATGDIQQLTEKQKPLPPIDAPRPYLFVFRSQKKTVSEKIP